MSKLDGEGADTVVRFQAWLRAADRAASTARAYGTLAGEFVAFVSAGGLVDAAVLDAVPAVRSSKAGQGPVGVGSCGPATCSGSTTAASPVPSCTARRWSASPPAAATTRPRARSTRSTFQEAYLRSIFGFVGFTDGDFIYVQPTDVPGMRESALASAVTRAQLLASACAGAKVPLR